MRPCGASYAMQKSPWGLAFLDLGLLSTLPHGALIPVKARALGVYPAQKSFSQSNPIFTLSLGLLPHPIPSFSGICKVKTF
jgi:hypothetical protein